MFKINNQGFTLVAAIILFALAAGGAVAYVVLENPFGQPEGPSLDDPVFVDPLPEAPFVESVPTPEPVEVEPEPASTPNPTPVPTPVSTACFSIPQTEFIGPDDGYYLVVGEILNPNNECGSYFENIITGESVTPYGLSEEERAQTKAYSCLGGEIIEGCEIPPISYTYTYSEYADGNAAMKVRDEVMADIFAQLHERKNSSYSLADIKQLGGLLAAWADEHHKTVLLNGEPLLQVGGNAGGYSPVEMPPIDGASLAGQLRVPVYELYANWNNALMSAECDANFFEEYVTSIVPKEYLGSGSNYTTGDPATTEELATELSCLGTITFKDVPWGSH